MGLVSATTAADMGYLAAAKEQCRERWRVAVLTKLRLGDKLMG
jgi:hypothetical protein